MIAILTVPSVGRDMGFDWFGAGTLPEGAEQDLNELFGAHLGRPETKLRMLRNLVVGIDAREVLDQSLARLAVEALGIALLAHGERRVDEDLDEVAVAEELAREPTLRPERGDER